MLLVSVTQPIFTEHPLITEEHGDSDDHGPAHVEFQQGVHTSRWSSERGNYGDWGSTDPELGVRENLMTSRV